MRTIILDTDIDTDCDDTGALAVLHALERDGACAIAAVVCSLPIPDCAGAVRAINRCYGRDDLPVGLLAATGFAGRRWRSYREHRRGFMAGSCPGIAPYNHLLASQSAPAAAEDAVALYRRILADAEDGGVTICAIGTLSALADLLASPADATSPLIGRELVRRRVRELVCMAVASWPAGREAFNWRMDPAAAAAVVDGWPGPLTVCERGSTVMTGARFVAAAPAGHPVAVAYRTCLGGPGRDRPSWDLVTALYAVRGPDGGFALSPEQDLIVDARDANLRWSSPCSGRARRIAVPVMPDDRLAVMLEDLMIAGLRPATAPGRLHPTAARRRSSSARTAAMRAPSSG